MTEIEKEAVWLSKAVLRLEANGYIQTEGGNDDEELDCEHLRRIAIHHARKIQSLVLESEKAEQ